MSNAIAHPLAPLVLLPTGRGKGAADTGSWRGQIDALGADTLPFSPSGSGWQEQLAALRTRFPGRDLIWLRAPGVEGQADCLARLLKAAGVAPGAVLALSNREAALTPAAPDCELATTDWPQIDDALFALSGRSLVPVEAHDPPLLALAAAADAAAAAMLADHVYVHDPDTGLKGLPTPADRREREPAHALAELRRSLQGLGTELSRPWSQATRDARPVLLHLLHGWGGGAERFVRDLAASDLQRHHLLLRACGNPSRRRHGEALELLDAGSGSRLRRWPLFPAIGAIADRHAGYAAVLAEVIADFAVERVLVSSLIGHALDALRCGLPLVWVAHDYFPFWPLLHRDFGDPQGRFDRAELQRDLAAQHDGPFSEREPAFWWARREACIAALIEARATLVAPTRGVLDNLGRMAPELAALPALQIPHGLAPWAGAVELGAADASGRLRLVVPGRIHGGKGLDLLRRCLPALTRHAEIFLVGAGKAAEALFGQSGVHILMDYRRDELPAILARVCPHAALLPATVAETFSYTLSEVWSLGLVPIATRIGAFAERIEDGVDGFLVEPRADAMLARIAALDADREPLAQARQRLLSRPPRTLAAMLDDYAPLLPQGERAPLRYRLRRSDIASQQAAVLADALLDHELRLARAESRVGEQEQELARRADWGFSLSRLVDARTGWARQLEEELGRTRHHLASREEELQGRFANEQAHRLALEASLVQVQGELQRTMDDARQIRENLVARIEDLNREAGERERILAALNDANQALQDHNRLLGAELEAILAQQRELQARQQELTGERDQLRAEAQGLRQERDLVQAHRDDMLRSTSWKLTTPLRWAGLLLKRIRASLAFRSARARSLAGRVRGSLARHGLGGTLRRIREELARGAQPLPPPVQLAAPIPEASYEAFELPCSPRPLVSIVVPVYNQLHHTWQCLRALRDCASDTPIEVIVVDDGSSDSTASELPRIGGLRFHRNAQNLGFIGACNAGASLARGRFLFFLNNDTAVQPGWLQPLLDTHAQFDRVGLVGSKLVYPDGRLQEAGGIVFDDGSGWNYGRFDHPDDPRYDYPREADYCSGAAILIEKALFDRFGGFDSLYRPAYYEDTDLAFKVREAGLRVIYQPASRVVHFEGITSGTDTGSGTKRYQLVNQGKFRERWAEALSRQPAPTDHAGIWRAATHRAAGRILLIDATTPTPDQDSGSVRYINLVRVLRVLGWQCTFFADNRAQVPGYTEALRALGVEVQFHPWLGDPVEFFRQRGAQFDAIMLSRHYVACQYVDLARQYAPQALLLFDTVDLHYLREQRAAAVAGSEAMARQAEHTRKSELDLVQRCDITLVVSPVEQELLAREAPGRRVEVLSNIHELHGCRRGYAERKDLWFVGGFQHQPNVDAVLWFSAEIWPTIRRELPEARFHVVGSKMPPEVAALAGEGIEIHGFVADIEPFLDGCRLAVAPLRYGAGVKGKVNQSMAYGQPVVATPMAVEGMAIEDGQAALVAENAADFAAAVLRLYRDPVLWQTLSEGGLANIREHFSFEAASSNLERILRRKDG